MATPKKKHLIELMIEAGVKWRVGAEYAAQDNRDLYVWFYSEKPKLAGVNKGKWTSDVNYENGRKCRIVDGEKLNEICLDWHQTIVTREQYEEALIERAYAVTFTNKSNQLRESEDIPAVDATEWHNHPSIEQLASDYYAKAAEADRLQAIADEALKDADDALFALEKAGELIGLVISIATKMKPVEQPTDPEQPIITDWRDLQVGDVIECTAYNDKRNDPWPGGWATKNIGTRQVVSKINDSTGKISIKDNQDSGYAFKFIRRP